MTTPKRVLIAGAGIAGPAASWFLVQNGHTVTIVERAPAMRTTGQQIDVAGHGVEIVKMMGVWEQLLERSVGDQGIEFVDVDGKSWASFPVDKESGASSFVKEVEILRGDMAEVLYERTKEVVEYVFDDFVTGLKEGATHVTVSFNRSQDRDFDIVIAADGIYSKTREIAFGKAAAEIKSLQQCTALMTIPWQESDGAWSKWYNAPGRRCVCLRPQPKTRRTGAYLAVMTSESRNIARLPLEEQQDEFEKLFQNAGWEAPRVLREMRGNETMYVQETAQVYCPRWTKGRVALIGDAAYCPSGVSGQGTTLAYVGAYILAGCICTYEDAAEALAKYEEQVRPFAEKGQKLLPGVPGVANPQTAWGIKVFYTILWIGSLVTKSGLPGWLSWLSTPFAPLMDKELELPRYSSMSASRNSG